MGKISLLNELTVEEMLKLYELPIKAFDGLELYVENGMIKR